MSQRKRRVAPQRPTAVATPPSDVVRLPAGRALLLPVAFALLLAGFALLPSINRNPVMVRYVLVTSGALLIWAAGLAILALRRARALAIEVERSQAALPAGLRAVGDPRLLGLVLAPRSTRPRP